LATCRELDVGIIAEGIESADEYVYLRAKGVTLFQGYYFARPGFRSLPEIAPDALALLKAT